MQNQIFFILILLSSISISTNGQVEDGHNLPFDVKSEDPITHLKYFIITDYLKSATFNSANLPSTSFADLSYNTVFFDDFNHIDENIWNKFPEEGRFRDNEGVSVIFKDENLEINNGFLIIR